MAQRILGVDLGAWAVKAVLLESTYHGFAVLEHGGEVLPPPEEGKTLLSRQVAALQQLIEARDWKFAEVMLALPGAGMSSSVVTLPFTDLRRIEQTLSFEVEEQIPFPLDEVAWDWQVLGSREGKTDLHVGLVRRDDLAGLLAAVAPLGIDPRAVIPPAPVYAALITSRVVGLLPGTEVDEVTGVIETTPGAEVIVDLGQERTSICVVFGGTCEQARTFPFGAVQLARAIARELACPEERAHALLSAVARGQPLEPDLQKLGADPRAADALRRVLSGLVRELRATLRTWRTRVGPHRVARVLLAGELARLPGLAELLAPEVDGPVQPLLLEGPAATIPAEDAPTYGLALALALRGHQGSHAPRLNLRRGPLAYTRDFEHVKGKVIRLAVAAALLVVLALASAGMKMFALARQGALLDKALCDAEQKLVGKCFDNYLEAESVLKGKGPGGAALPKASAVDLLAELSERVPRDVEVKFEKMDVTRDKLHLEGATATAENVDRLVSALKTSRCFGDAKSGATRKRGDGKFEFSIDSGLTCLESGAREPAGGKG
jgi:general secretion pathway protein L